MTTEDVFRNFDAALRRYVAARVPAQAADDVLQYIYERIHGRSSALRDDERIGGWVFRIASNIVADHHRRRGKEPIIGVARGDETVAAPRERDAREELALCVRPFVDMLEEPYRAALRMTELEGLAMRQAASRENASVSGMKSRVQRGRQQLRGLLEQCCTIDTDIRGRVTDFQPKGCDRC